MKLDVYVGNLRLDLFKDEAITLNDSIQKIQDISKVFTPFTQQFNIPASNTNNKVFKHFYKDTITAAFSYDARFRSAASLRLNGANYKKGKVQLTGVSLKNNKPYSYKIVFYGDTASLNDILAEKELKDLYPLDTYDFTIGSTLPVSAFTTGIQTDGVAATNVSNRNVIIPIMSTEPFYILDNTDATTPNNFSSVNNFELGKDVKPAIKIKRIIEAIATQFNLTFNMTDETIGGITYTSFFGSDVFDELYMLLYRKAVSTTIPSSLAGASIFYGLNYQFYGIKLTLSDFTIISGGGTDVLTAGTLVITEEFSYTLRFRFLATFASSNGIPISLKITDKKTGELISVSESTANNVTASGIAVPFINSGTLASRTLDLVLEIRNETGVPLSFQALNTLADFSLQIDKFNRSDSSLVSNSYYGNSAFQLANTFFIQDNTPVLKCIDFLSGLFKTFNLTAFTLPDQGQKIYVMTFDDFMTLGNERNITKYIDFSKSEVARTIPFSQIDYAYNKPKINASIRYINYNGSNYGDLNYAAPEDFEGKSFSLKVPFERIVLENAADEDGKNRKGVMYPWLVTNDQKPVEPAPYIFFNIQKTVSADNSITTNNYTTFNMCSNISSDENHSLAFGTEQIDSGGSLNKNGLFSRFYQQYIVQAFEIKARIISITAILPLSILLNYRLNDTLVIAGQKYYINSIKTNLLTRKTQLELITKINPYTASVLT